MAIDRLEMVPMLLLGMLAVNAEALGKKVAAEHPGKVMVVVEAAPEAVWSAASTLPGKLRATIVTKDEPSGVLVFGTRSEVAGCEGLVTRYVNVLIQPDGRSVGTVVYVHVYGPQGPVQEELGREVFRLLSKGLREGSG